MFVCCERYVLSGTGLSDELITCPEESYRLWCVVMCDLESSRMRRPWPALGRSAIGKEKKYRPVIIVFLYQLDAQFFISNISITFLTFLHMFRTLLCSSSGGQIV
jgi:hypothetical protein